MMRLKSRLLSLNAEKSTKVKVFSPENTKELRIPFKQEKTAKVVGRNVELKHIEGFLFSVGKLLTAKVLAHQG